MESPKGAARPVSERKAARLASPKPKESPTPEARARHEGEGVGIADVVEMQPVELGMTHQQLGEELGQVVAHARCRRVEPDRGRPHAVPPGVRRGHLVLGIIQDRAPLVVDDRHVASELVEDRCLAVRGEARARSPRRGTRRSRSAAAASRALSPSEPSGRSVARVGCRVGPFGGEPGAPRRDRPGRRGRSRRERPRRPSTWRCARGARSTRCEPSQSTQRPRRRVGVSAAGTAVVARRQRRCGLGRAPRAPPRARRRGGGAQDPRSRARHEQTAARADASNWR